MIFEVIANPSLIRVCEPLAIARDFWHAGKASGLGRELIMPGGGNPFPLKKVKKAAAKKKAKKAKKKK
jgi:hypothetical protein